MGVLSWLGSKLGLDDGHGNLAWTPADVPDQADRVFIITGGNSGIGFEVARHLVERGAHVILASRDLDKCTEAVRELQQHATAAGSKGTAEAAELKLGSIPSIQRFAEGFAASGQPLACLVNNAGVFLPPYSQTEWGSENTIGTNYAGHFLLTHLLLGCLRSATPSRVVWVTRTAEAAAKPALDDPLGMHCRDSGMATYGTSKAYILMAAREMQRRGGGAGVEHFAVQPGLVRTPLLRMDPGATKMDPWKPSAILMWLQDKLLSQSAELGCWSTLYAATQPELAGEGGSYYGPLHLLPQPLNLCNTALLSPHCRAAKDAGAMASLYDATVSELERLLGGPLPNAMHRPGGGE